MINGKKYITIQQEDCHVTFNWLLVQLGLAKPISSRSTCKIYEDIKWIGEDSAAREDGIWSDDSEYLDENLRKVCYQGDMEYHP
jgi:hypothetical protein